MSEQTVVANIKAPKPDMKLVSAAIAELARQSAAEPEFLRFDAHLSVKEPTRPIIHESWANEEAPQSYRGSVHVAQIKASLNGTKASVWASAFHPLS